MWASLLAAFQSRVNGVSLWGGHQTLPAEVPLHPHKRTQCNESYPPHPTPSSLSNQPTSAAPRAEWRSKPASPVWASGQRLPPAPHITALPPPPQPSVFLTYGPSLSPASLHLPRRVLDRPASISPRSFIHTHRCYLTSLPAFKSIPWTSYH